MSLCIYKIDRSNKLEGCQWKACVLNTMYLHFHVWWELTLRYRARVAIVSLGSEYVRCRRFRVPFSPLIAISHSPMDSPTSSASVTVILHGSLAAGFFPCCFFPLFRFFPCHKFQKICKISVCLYNNNNWKYATEYINGILPFPEDANGVSGWKHLSIVVKLTAMVCLTSRWQPSNWVRPCLQ